MNPRPAARLVTDQQIAQLQEYVRARALEVEGHILRDDVDGANEVCNRIIAEAGRGVHDLVLKLFGFAHGLPYWRTFPGANGGDSPLA